MSAFLMLLIPVIVGAILVPSYDWFKHKILTSLQKLPPWLTQIIVASCAFGLTKLVTAGVALTGVDVTLLTQGDLGNLAAAALAFLFKLSKVVKPPTT